MRKHYTKEEDKIILEMVKASPTNIKDGFRKASKKIKRSVASVRIRYYKYLREKDKVFALFSSKKKAINYKITRKGKRATSYKPGTSTQSKWKRILAILFE